MNKLELLLKRMKAGSIKDPDLLLALQYIHSIQLDKHNESESTSVEGINGLFNKPNKNKSPRPTKEGF